MKEQVICPYCGKPNQLDPPLECCGEVHAEKVISDNNVNDNSDKKD